MGLALLRIFAWFAAPFWIASAYLVVTGGPSWSAVAYVIAMGVMLGGCLTLPFPEQPFRRRRGVTRGGALAIVLIAIAHALTVGTGRTVHVVDGNGGNARVVSRFVEESDVDLAMTRALFGIGMLHNDSEETPSAMKLAYAELTREQGHLASPFLGTHLGLQSASWSDLVLVDPEPGPFADAAVVFLHGSAGNFVLPCFELGKAVRSLGVTTACPSANWAAEWDSENGRITLETTLTLLRGRGMKRFVLAGLSAGGYGASLLAPKMKGTFVGLLLLSGADPAAETAGIPTLVIHGTHDTMADIADAERYVANTNARFIEVDAGHFAFLVRSEPIARDIRSFVEARFAQ